MKRQDIELLLANLPSIDALDAMLADLDGDAPERPALLALRDRAVRQATLLTDESEALLANAFGTIEEATANFRITETPEEQWSFEELVRIARAAFEDFAERGGTFRQR